MIVDTHCHLDDHRYGEGALPLIERGRAAGVGAFVTIGVGESIEDMERAVAMASAHPDVWATVGVHPHDARLWGDAWREALVRLAAHPRVVAIGEIGLDHHYDHSARDEQALVFRELVRFAREVRKPIVVHTRSAPEETLRILEEERAGEVGGIIHCFSEDRPFAERALDMNFDVSFSGIVTFKNAQAIQEVAAWAPADRILVETDSPYLAPIPHRGKRCEPAYVVHTVAKVAALRGVGVDEVAAVTTANAARRLGLVLSPSTAPS